MKVYFAVAATAILSAAPASAEVSANIGYQSQYIFRGIPQADTSAQGGIDFEESGFSVGAWAADVDMGAEVDIYGAYGWSVGDVSFAIGGTGYYYTDDFDDTYTELNLSAGYEWLSVSYNVGKYDNFGGPEQDYTFASFGVSHAGVNATVGIFGDDFDGEYYELSYGFDVSGLDLSIGYIYSTDMLVGDDNSNLYFGIGKSFGILD